MAKSVRRLGVNVVGPSALTEPIAALGRHAGQKRGRCVGTVSELTAVHVADRSLLRRTREGDPEAFAAFYRSWSVASSSMFVDRKAGLVSEYFVQRAWRVQQRSPQPQLRHRVYR